MDKNAVVAIVVCIIFYLGYNQYLGKKYPQQDTPGEKNEQVAKEGEAGVATSQTPVAEPSGTNTEDTPVKQLSGEELTFANDNSIITFDQNLSAITSVKLKKYRLNKDSPNGEYVEVMDSPFVAQGTRNITQEFGLRGFHAEREGNTIRFWKQDGQWLVKQEFTVPQQGYNVGVKVTFENLADEPRELTGGLWAQENLMLPKSGGFGPASFVAAHKRLVQATSGTVDDENLASYCEETDGEKAFAVQNDTVDFVGFDNHYFLSVVQPVEEKTSLLMSKGKVVEGSYCPINFVSYQQLGMVEPRQSVGMQFKAYFGPKDVTILKAHDPKLLEAVDFGIFSVLAYPLLLAIKTFYKVTHNYGIAIILLTVILKILFYPLTKAAAVSMKKMQKFQPEMNKIRERNKDDPRRQQQELMAFMAKNKVNPAKGCLPILPQIPVFIAFYNVLSQAIELRHSEFFGWITDLSVADPYYVTPVLLGIGMFIQQKLTPNPSMDKAQERVMMMLPVIFTVMMLSLPAGMVLYMITNTIVSIGQQQWLNKKLAYISASATTA